MFVGQGHSQGRVWARSTDVHISMKWLDRQS